MVAVTDEIKTQTVDPTPKGQDLPKGAESNSKETPKHYTESEYKKGIEDAIAQYGDRIKKDKLDPITRERDTFKAQVEQVKKEATAALDTLKETQDEINSLKEDIESLSETNPDSAELIKLKKELRAAELQVKKDYKAKEEALEELKRTTQAEREQWAAVVSEAQAMKLAVDTFEVAEDFEGGDSEKLKSLCEDRIEISGKPMSREDVEKLASRLWNKKSKETEPKEPDILNDSGLTSGGESQTRIKIQQDYVNSKISAVEYQKRMKAIGIIV